MMAYKLYFTNNIMLLTCLACLDSETKKQKIFTGKILVKGGVDNLASCKAGVGTLEERLKGKNLRPGSLG